MNYYRLHIGDYLRDTAHLSLLEHGVYARLLQVYYTREAPIADGEKYRVVGARSDEERRAVDAVLDEFFALIDGLWVQDRCDREIDAYKEKAATNREVGKLGGNPKKKRGYNEPGHLYAVRKASGGSIKVGISKWLASRLSALRNQHGAIDVLATVEVTDMGSAEAAVHEHFAGRLHGEWIKADWLEIEAQLGALLAPFTQPSGHPIASRSGALANSHKPITKETHTPRASAVDLAVAMRKAGVRANGAHPEVMALAEQGVSVETAVAACEEARKRLPGEEPPVGYVVRILESWARRAGAAHVNGATVPRAGLDDIAIERIQAELEAEERNATARLQAVQ